MPVIINEIEVLEQPAAQPPGQGSAPAPAPAIPWDGILQLVRDANGRQRRLVAD